MCTCVSRWQCDPPPSCSDSTPNSTSILFPASSVAFESGKQTSSGVNAALGTYLLGV
ncbi:hypothetical protein BofuT4_uP084860.1 [Botrytis cinerea T4]|uniref:Uncharacterized protein n=1 Tax=Botryotinia fuckeliana (strain T4) TaxID=999810 RepID=G2YJP5_BOTF4|nr:hypothetical protein BofuT4_uP084860.1 [Botrytis cinerea T4]